MTSEMVAKQGGIQEVLFGLAVAMTESERKIHNKKSICSLVSLFCLSTDSSILSNVLFKYIM
jgi:hypothetical protein